MPVWKHWVTIFAPASAFAPAGRLSTQANAASSAVARVLRPIEPGTLSVLPGAIERTQRAGHAGGPRLGRVGLHIDRGGSAQPSPQAGVADHSPQRVGQLPDLAG